MLTRLRYIFRFFCISLLLFLLQKPLFMLYCGLAAHEVSGADFWQVLYHSLPLDLAMSAYLTIVPFVVLTVSCFFSRFPLRKILTVYFVLVGLLMSLVFCGDAALYSFWGYKLDASVFFYLQSPKDAVASVSLGFLLLGIFLVLILAAVIAACYWIFTPKTLLPVEGRSSKGLAQMGLWLAVAFGIFVAMRGGLGKSTANVGMAYFSNNQFLNHSAVNPMFSLFYSMSKQEDFAKQYRYVSDRECTEWMNQLFPQPTEADTTLSVLKTQNPNLLLIVLEGFGGAFVEELGGMKDVAPNLARLSEEGVFFTQCYAGSFRTDRGTVCLLSGFPGLPSTSVMKLPSKSRNLPSISAKMAAKGYHTTFLYGGDANFTNMKSYLLSMGFQKIISDVDFSIAERTSNEWGANDEITFSRLYNMIRKETATPWFTMFLTLSSHEPFEVPYHRLDDPIPNAFAYTDSCLGDFIDRLKTTPQWDNLLVVCIPDHGFFYPKDGLNHGPLHHRIPMLWLGGAIKHPMRVETIMNQTDMAATLLAQLGDEHSDFPFSRNVLCSSYNTPWAFYTFIDGFGFIDSTGQTLFDNVSRQSIYESAPEGAALRAQKGKAYLQGLYNALDQL